MATKPFVASHSNARTIRDFDGFNGLCDIKNSAELVKIPEALSCAGFTDDEIEKICYKNAWRVMKDVV